MAHTRCTSQSGVMRRTSDHSPPKLFPHSTAPLAVRLRSSFARTKVLVLCETP